MKKIIWFSNLVYYGLYKSYIKFDDIIGYPFKLFAKNPWVKAQFKRRNGSDIEKEMQEANKVVMPYYAEVFMGNCHFAIHILIIMGILISISKFLDSGFAVNKIVMGVVLVVSYAMSHYAVFHKDRYKKYFKEFDKFPKRKRLAYSWFSVLLLWISLGFFIFSLAW